MPQVRKFNITPIPGKTVPVTGIGTYLTVNVTAWYKQNPWVCIVPSLPFNLAKVTLVNWCVVCISQGDVGGEWAWKVEEGGGLLKWWAKFALIIACTPISFMMASPLSCLGGGDAVMWRGHGDGDSGDAVTKLSLSSLPALSSSAPPCFPCPSFRAHAYSFVPACALVRSADAALVRACTCTLSFVCAYTTLLCVRLCLPLLFVLPGTHM